MDGITDGPRVTKIDVMKIIVLFHTTFANAPKPQNDKYISKNVLSAESNIPTAFELRSL
jgi:hypothetical protein